MNLIELIKSELGSDVIEKLGSLVGADANQTGMAAGVAVPGFLAVLAKLVTGGKAESVIDALKQVGTELEGGFGDILSSDKASEVQKKGGSLLESLLGSSYLPIILGLLARFSGISAASIKNLLSYLAPMILAIIAKQFSGKPLDSGALSSFFAEQKGNISAALPAGLSLDSIPSLGAQPAMSQPTADQDSGLPSWLLPLVALGLLGAVAWYFFGSQPASDAVPAAGTLPTVKKEAPAVASNMPRTEPAPLADTSKLTTDLAGVLTALTDTLGGVKDAASAEAAAPKITGSSNRLEELKGLWDKLPDEFKKTVAKTISDQLPKIKDLIAKVLALPGVSEKLKPVLDVLLSRLAAFAAG